MCVVVQIWPTFAEPDPRNQTWRLGGLGESCNTVCEELDLVCEPSIAAVTSVSDTPMHEFYPGDSCGGVANRDSACAHENPCFANGYCVVDEASSCRGLEINCAGTSPTARRFCPCIPLGPPGSSTCMGPTMAVVNIEVAGSLFGMCVFGKAFGRACCKPCNESRMYVPTCISMDPWIHVFIMDLFQTQRRNDRNQPKE